MEDSNKHGTSTKSFFVPGRCQRSDRTAASTGRSRPLRPHSRSDSSSTSAARAKRLRRATRYRLLPTAHAHPLRLHWWRMRCSSRKLRAGRRRHCACGGVPRSGQGSGVMSRREEEEEGAELRHKEELSRRLFWRALACSLSLVAVVQENTSTGLPLSMQLN
ncbi:ASNSD1 upstream open reading frame protein isoform X2 [Tympanuchus pallidicinctus]|uniref:ASNSD1 upstream open reading frame protein isoform X2 n=1 Tax=Tympanuchus pallidicinctus TaxID=109042 RepID=UPI00228724B9|nr:ASNSD1 upstream open reading frame protein isoform X2 [Tympanuchus pallidicinctus]